MSTTNVFIEQVIIGLLVLLVAGLLASTELLHWLLGADPGKLVVAAAIAYMVGIVCDRMADTVLSRLEQYNRLHFAAEQAAEREQLPRRWAGDALDDPFPEGEYRVALLQSEASSKYADYLRSRIRLTRALAYAAPALAIGSSVQVMQNMAKSLDDSLLIEGAAVPYVRYAAIALVVVAYALALVLRSGDTGSVLHSRLGDEVLGTAGMLERARQPVRTRDMANPTYRAAFIKATGPRDALAGFVWRNDVALAATALSVCALSFVPAMLAGQATVGALIALSGIALTAASGWCWWRITRTFFAFLRDFATMGARAAEGPGR